MTCTSCGAANEPGRKFCGECGTRLAVTCPACGTANVPTARFCGECGSPVTAAAEPRAAANAAAVTAPTAAAPSSPRPPLQSSAPIAERRLVTILFADLVGFTPFAEGRDAEEVRDTLSRYFAVCREVIERYGGTVEKFIGDAVMAVWGAPVAHEDDAERAVRAALELTDAVRVLGPGIGARAGVLTGEAAVTLGATDQGMVAGDLVNTASRLQSVAPAGGVLVGEATQRAASGAVVFEPAGEQVLKGKTAPVAAWRALRVVAERGGRNRSEALEAPFVGREDELRLLKDLLHATGRERRARLVSVTGQAGIGKSRLAWEFLKYVDGLIEDVYWHSGRSPSYGEGITFWALGEMVRSRVGLAESDDPQTTREKVRAAVREWVLEPAEQRWVEESLLVLLGAGEAPAGGREELFAGWRTFFERIAAHGTVALVFEDLQWADAGLLDFIDHLLEWSRGVPIFILTLARPELLERRSGWGAGRRNFMALDLEPLPETQMRALLAGLVPGLPEPVVRGIVARADGMPLYAVETVRMLVADGRLVERDGVYAPVGDIGTLAVPESLHALIAARLDALEPMERALLQDAAVLGQTFTVASLAAVAGLEPEALEPRLRMLTRRELLVQDVDPRSPERGQYGFVQALIREVAYSTIAMRDRRARHLAAARHFESLGDDELAGALAAHYLAAHQASGEGAEREALAAQARVALRAAAERAGSLGSHAQAARFYGQALEVTSDPADTADLLLAAGGSASGAADHERSIELLRRAQALQQERDDAAGEMRVLAVLGKVLLEARQPDQALALLEPLASGSVSPEETDRIGALGQLARALFFLNDDERAVAAADRVLTAAEAADLVPVIADTLITKGAVLANSGRGYEGISILRGAIDLATSHGLTELAVRGRINLSGHLNSRDPRESLAVCRVALTDSQRIGLRSHWVTVLTNAAFSALRTGDWDWAVMAVDEARQQDWGTGERVALDAVAVTYLALRGGLSEGPLAQMARDLGEAGQEDPTYLDATAWVALQAGRYGDASAAWARLAAIDPLNATYGLALAGRVSLWDGDAASVRAAIEGIVATRSHGRALDAERRNLEAGLAALQGRPDEARPTWRDTLVLWQEMGLRLDEALTGMDMLCLLGPADAEARAAAAAARDILAGLGATPLLRQVDAWLERTDEPSARRPSPAPSGAATTSAGP